MKDRKKINKNRLIVREILEKVAAGKSNRLNQNSSENVIRAEDISFSEKTYFDDIKDVIRDRDDVNFYEKPHTFVTRFPLYDSAGEEADKDIWENVF